MRDISMIQKNYFLTDPLSVDTLFLDFPKAFDHVPYQRFLIKLKSCEISDSFNNWIKC